MIKKLATGAVALLLVGLGVAPAHADPVDSVQAQIDAVLVEHPGGQQVSPTTISWAGGAILLTFADPRSSDSMAADPHSRAVGSCATGSYCAWSGTSYTGTKLSFTGCSAAGSESSLSLLGGAVRSLANARTSGLVRSANGASTVHLISPNTGITSNTSTLTKLVCTT